MNKQIRRREGLLEMEDLTGFRLLDTEEKKCPCGAIGKLTIDHIVPKSILRSYLNDQENKQVLCHDCNSIKGHKIDLNNPKTLPILKGLLGKLEDLIKRCEIDIEKPSR